MRSDAGMSEKGAAERLHALDAVRGFALLLGVVFHAALAFLPGPQAWLVMEQSRSATIAVMAFPLHMFRLTIFFLIAGCCWSGTVRGASQPIGRSGSRCLW